MSKHFKVLACTVLWREICYYAGLVIRMLNGEWSEKDFLIVEPGHMIRATNRDDIMESVPAGKAGA